MADAKATATKLPNLAVVERSISAGKRLEPTPAELAADPNAKGKLKGPAVTKDGLDHKAGAVVIQMGAATTIEEFAKKFGEFNAQVAAKETGQPVVLVTTKGVESAPKVAAEEYTDGKNALVRGKDIYPVSIAALVDFVNKTIQANAAAKLTAFNNTHKVGYGEGGGTSSGIDSLDNVA